jgi:hypothetical protein
VADGPSGGAELDGSAPPAEAAAERREGENVPPGRADPADAASRTAEALAALQARLSGALDSYSGPGDGRGGAEDVHQLLRVLRVELAARTVAACVTDLPGAPKLLLYASRDASIVGDPGAANDLCACLLLYARGEGRDGGFASRGSAVRRAGAWALGLLCGMLQSGGGHGRAEKGSPLPMPSCPQDAMNCAAARWTAGELRRRLQAVSTLSDGGAAAVYNVCAELAHLTRLPNLEIDATDLLPVIDAAVVAAGRVRVSLTSSASSAGGPFPAAFTRRLLGCEAVKIDGTGRVGDRPGLADEGEVDGGWPPLFDRLSAEAQAACLRLVPGAFERHLSHLQARLFSPVSASTSAPTSFSDELEAVAACGRAAAQDLSLHWQVIDALHREMTGSPEPFSGRHWARRRLVRAVHASIAAEVSLVRDAAGVGGKALLEAAPMFRRFALHLRPLVAALDAFGMCLRASTAGLEALHDAMVFLSPIRAGEAGAIVLAVDAHAVLLAMETQVQVIVASAVLAITAAQGDGRPPAAGLDSIEALSRVVCSIDTTRERGGALVDSPGEWRVRWRRLYHLLVRLVPGHKRAAEGKVSSAAAASSPAFWKDLNLAESLAAPIIVTAGGVVGAPCYPPGGSLAAEVVRMCEVAKKLMPVELQTRIGLTNTFNAAMGRAVSPATANLGANLLDAQLLARKDAWETDAPAM